VILKDFGHLAWGKCADAAQAANRKPLVVLGWKDRLTTNGMRGIVSDFIFSTRTCASGERQWSTAAR
jgi:hypothetical protein